MEWEKVTIQVAAEAAEAASALLYEAGTQGIVIDDDQEAVLSLVAYLPLDDRLTDRLRDLEAGLQKLETFFHDAQVCWEHRNVSDVQWKDNWKAFFHPRRIGRRTVVVPSWETYNARPEDLVLLLDPEMAFGTGDHPTTAGCLRYLETYLAPGDRVADVGCGSGILAIAAAKGGAGRVLALENDFQALKTARDNGKKNAVSVVFGWGDLLEGVEEPFDLITANLVADLVVHLVPQAARLLRAGGTLIVSGILDVKWELVAQALRSGGFEILDKTLEDEWITVAGRKR